MRPAGERGRAETEKEFYVSPSYASGTLTDLHFGLGTAERADRVEITWPGGRVQVFPNLAARKIYSVQTGEDLRSREGTGATTSPR